MEKAYRIEQVLFRMLSTCGKKKQCISQFRRYVFHICTENIYGNIPCELAFKEDLGYEFALHSEFIVLFDFGPWVQIQRISGLSIQSQTRILRF